MPVRILIAALLCVAIVAKAGASPVTGRLGTDAGAAPSLTVHAWALGAEKLYSVTTERGQANYTLDLPRGRYWVFATPAEPGAPPLVGAHTEFSTCVRDAERRRAGDCREHGLRTILVTGRRLDGIDVTDWAPDDESTQSLDRILGRQHAGTNDEAQLAAPKFSEYPAGPLTTPRATALVAGSEPRVERDRAVLAAALAGAPTFAGRMALVRPPCGPDCVGAALLDLATGRVAYPPALDALPAPTACTDRGSVLYRSDSRLLTVTASVKSEVVTRYFVWDAETGVLKPVAVLSSALLARCEPGR